MHKFRSIFVLALIVGACGSDGEAAKEPDQARWCDLASSFVSDTANAGEVTDDELQEWVSASPDEVSSATTIFVDVTRELRQKIADADPEDLREVTREALGAMLENPEFDVAGQEIEAYANSNCEGFQS